MKAGRKFKQSLGIDFIVAFGDQVNRVKIADKYILIFYKLFHEESKR